MSKLSIPEPKKINIKFDKNNVLILREPLGDDMIKLEAYTKDASSQTEAILKAIVLLQEPTDGDDPLLYTEVKRFPSGWINHVADRLSDLSSKPKS